MANFERDGSEDGRPQSELICVSTCCGTRTLRLQLTSQFQLRTCATEQVVFSLARYGELAVVRPARSCIAQQPV